ncbi:receptor-like serine/threonine-protein kinase ALE2 isoform X2 [Phoenix dactylifera]|uniref:Receptor-like serine/threonine-protein kinase ALE2 isoform X2 n=1 Tax=Phoenix dactylifera TaxID=42345 RepID=A0A8B7BRA0_PHODC|nr:receptor-like serine/threonine-protein kinase ALE2 isoform X2 [Phoenix dactylifera]
MSFLLIVLLSLLRLVAPTSARPTPTTQALSPLGSPMIRNMMPLGPITAPAYSPEYHGSPANHPVPKHHQKIPHAVPPTSVAPPQNQGCDEFFCSEPFTSTPIGSPCGCVYPMQVKIDLGVAPYQLFSRIEDLEVEVAASTFLKQSQVRIMGAGASIRDPEMTRVTIDLVPLGEKFDRMTALLTYDRFWQKKVQINTSIFGDYDVIYVHYPGLPSSPPSMSEGFVGPSGFGSQQYPFTADVHPGKMQKMNTKTIALISLSSFILVFICFGLVCIIWKWKKLVRPPADVGPAIPHVTTRKTGVRSISSSSMASSMSVSFVSTLATRPPSVKTFSVAELEKATDKFSSKKVLGEGGFGRVYHGIMEDGSEVAVKLLTREDQNGDREFIAEVEMLSQLHHRNLVKLIGICIEGHKRCLVYELVRNGSVESHLHGADKMKGPLDWDTRMKIALGAARGLAYLHEDSNPRVIHRDFKASNVLLEDDFTPKVSDFGLARVASEGIHHISTQVMGTFGYVAPEYAMTGHLLVKSDVYSYGVVLLELLSGRKPVYMSQSQGPKNLVTWARPLLTSREGLGQLMDPSLNGKYDFDNMAKVAAIASMCVHAEASQRPFMGEVVQALKLIYNDMDETCDDSFSQRDSLGTDCGDFDHESSWWNGATPRLAYGYASSFITMEYASGPVEEMQRPHSASTLIGKLESLVGHNGSGPLRTKRQSQAFYRLRGSMSDHGNFSKHSGMDGYLS